MQSGFCCEAGKCDTGVVWSREDVKVIALALEGWWCLGGLVWAYIYKETDIAGHIIGWEIHAPRVTAR